MTTGAYEVIFEIPLHDIFTVRTLIDLSTIMMKWGVKVGAKWRNKAIWL